MQKHQKIRLNWTKKKPAFNKDSEECLLLVAVNIRGEWEYTLYEMRKLKFEETWYWGILTQEGDEWGSYEEDLMAQLYCKLPLLPKSKK